MSAPDTLKQLKWVQQKAEIWNIIYLSVIDAKWNAFDERSTFDFLQVVFIWYFFVVDELIFVLSGFPFTLHHVQSKCQAFVNFLL